MAILRASRADLQPHDGGGGEDYEASVPEVAYKVDEEPIESDAELQLLVDGWTQRAHEELGTPVGYNVAEIEKANWTMAKLDHRLVAVGVS